MQTILFAILLASIFLNVASQCVFTPILSGVTPLQSLGESVKTQISNAADCKQLCASQTAFNCTAFLWPAEGGDCYLYDTVNFSGDIFRDPMNSYVLYVQVCNGTIPSVGFCEFTLNQTGVTGTRINAISPGIASEASCRQFCIACYQGPVCNAYVVSADKNFLSQCLLYTQAPTGLSSGNVNLYIKTCSPPPLSCQYTSWSTFGSCTQNCIKNRQRQVLSQPTVGGAPCLDSELVDKQSCTDSPCVLTTPGATTVSATTTGSGTTQQCGASDYTSWTFWSTCDSTCQQYSNRSRSSTTCISNGDVLQLSQVCQGGNCQSSTTQAQNDVPVVAATFIPEIGCRIQSIDPQTRPSSKGFKAVGSQQSCSSRCAAETSFQCEAYSTTGPGGPCILHGAIDRVTLVIIMSNWYLQDINCVVNSSAMTSLCGWQMVRNAIGPLDTTASQWKSLGYAINADHCGTLCMMNHPMYSSTTCAAYAYSGTVSWLGSQNNCYMYTTIDNPWSFNSTGSYNLYKLVCIANSTSVASATQS